MKNICLFVLFHLSGILLFSQNNSYFSKVFSFQKSEGLESIYETDSFYYSIGYAADSPSYYPNSAIPRQYIFLYKHDKTGNVIDFKKYLDTNYAMAMGHGAATTTHDSGFIIAGVAWDTVQKMGLIMKLDKNLDTVWTKKIPDPDSIGGGQQTNTELYLSFRRVRQTWDKGYAAYGVFQGYNNMGDGDPFLLKLDSNGNEIWRRAFGSKYKDDSGNNFVLTPDSGYIIAWTPNNPPFEAKVVKLDKNGNQQWTKNYYSSLLGYGGEWGGARGLYISEDSNLFIALNNCYYNNVINYFRCTVLKVSLVDGHVIWDKTYAVNEDFLVSGIS
jgi:hypothetical protein